MRFNYSKTVNVEGQDINITVDHRGMFVGSVGPNVFKSKTPEALITKLGGAVIAERQRLAVEREERQIKKAASLTKPKVGNTTAWLREPKGPLGQPGDLERVEVRGKSGRDSWRGVKALITRANGKKEQVSTDSLFLASPDETDSYQALQAESQRLLEAVRTLQKEATPLSSFGRYSEVGKKAREAEATWDEKKKVWMVSVEGLEPFALPSDTNHFDMSDAVRDRMVAQEFPYAVDMVYNSGKLLKMGEDSGTVSSYSGIVSSSTVLFRTPQEAQALLDLAQEYDKATQALSAWGKNHRYDFGWVES